MSTCTVQQSAINNQHSCAGEPLNQDMTHAIIIRRCAAHLPRAVAALTVLVCNPMWLSLCVGGGALVQRHPQVQGPLQGLPSTSYHVHLLSPQDQHVDPTDERLGIVILDWYRCALETACSCGRWFGNRVAVLVRPVKAAIVRHVAVVVYVHARQQDEVGQLSSWPWQRPT